jgi:hypothetical protein
MTPQIELEEVEPRREWVDHWPPRLTAAADAVQQHDRRTSWIGELSHGDLDIAQSDGPLAAWRLWTACHACS